MQGKKLTQACLRRREDSETADTGKEKFRRCFYDGKDMT